MLCTPFACECEFRDGLNCLVSAEPSDPFWHVHLACMYLMFCNVYSDKLPLLSTSSLQHQYLFGFCFFRQSRDASARRGFVQASVIFTHCNRHCVLIVSLYLLQRSVVIITELPFVSLFKRAMRLLGPIHASAGSAVLEAAFLNINAWYVILFLHTPFAPTHLGFVLLLGLPLGLAQRLNYRCWAACCRSSCLGLACSRSRQCCHHR